MTLTAVGEVQQRSVALGFSLCNVCASIAVIGGRVETVLPMHRARAPLVSMRLILDAKQNKDYPNRSSTSRMRCATSDSLRFLLIAMLRSF